MPTVTPSIGTIGQPKKYLETEPPMADASKAPGYRGVGLSSPISSKNGGGNTGSSTSGSRTTTPPMCSPVSQYNNNTGIQPNVQPPQPEPYHAQSQHQYIADQNHQSAQINVERSRLNPRAPDFAAIKSNQNMVQTQQLYNQIPQNFLQPPMVPNMMPYQQKFQQQLPNLRAAPNNPSRWTHFINQPPPPFGRPALHPVNGNAEMFAGLEATASPPNMSPNLDERKVPPPKPIGTERAWKQNLIGENPHQQQLGNWADMKVQWPHHDLFRTPPPPPINFPLGPRPIVDDHNLFDSSYQVNT